HGELGLHVGAPLGPRAPGTPAPGPALVEEVAEQVAEVVGVERVAARSAGPTGAPGGTEAGAPHGPDRAELADVVVLTATDLVADDVVGGGDVLEPLLGRGVTGVGVGVQLAGELAVRAGDVLGRRRLRHAEDLVVVLLEPLRLRGHS